MRGFGSPQILKLHKFLVKAETENTVFSIAEYVAGSEWATKTARANLTKKLSRHVLKTDGGYRAVGVNDMSEEAFCHLESGKSA